MCVAFLPSQVLRYSAAATNEGSAGLVCSFRLPLVRPIRGNSQDSNLLISYSMRPFSLIKSSYVRSNCKLTTLRPLNVRPYAVISSTGHAWISFHIVSVWRVISSSLFFHHASSASRPLVVFLLPMLPAIIIYL